MNLATLRLRGVWLLILPFFWFAAPRPGLLAAGGALAVIGLAVRAWAASRIHKNQVLTTSGPYAYTRNPLYLGSFFLGLGATVAGGQPTFIVLFVIFFAAVYPRTMAREAAHLESLFGDRFRTYAHRVPLFFPRLAPYMDPEVVRSAPRAVEPRRYLHNREYEALLGTLAAFALLAAKMTWF